LKDEDEKVKLELKEQLKTYFNDFEGLKINSEVENNKVQSE
jgi:hypothetical protein